MKALLLVLALFLVTLKPSNAVAKDVKAMSRFELSKELYWKLEKMGFACVGSAVPVVALGVVDTIPGLSMIPLTDWYDGGTKDFYKEYFTNHDSLRAYYALVLGGAGSLVVDIIGGAADFVIAPFDYLAHGELKFEYKSFPTMQETYVPTRYLAGKMYSENSVCVTAKRQAEVLFKELKSRASSRDSFAGNSKVVELGRPKTVAKASVESVDSATTSQAASSR